jgi:hypothetical protein
LASVAAALAVFACSVAANNDGRTTGADGAGGMGGMRGMGGMGRVAGRRNPAEVTPALAVVRTAERVDPEPGPRIESAPPVLRGTRPPCSRALRAVAAPASARGCADRRSDR